MSKDYIVVVIDRKAASMLLFVDHHFLYVGIGTICITYMHVYPDLKCKPTSLRLMAKC